MSERLKIGLVGAGVFAGYHANKLAKNARVQFIGVYDPDFGKATALADKHNIEAMDASILYDICDAVVIACPASFHGQMALAALNANCHCLIEKPLATKVAEAEKIVAIAAAKNLIVQVGHQERMVLRAIGLDKLPQTPLRIEAIRSTVYSARGTDTSVTMDLMTHDIDLCTAIFGRAPDRIFGRSQKVKSNTADEAEARLLYGEAEVHLLASRIVEMGERKMKLTYSSGQVEIDFNAKTLTHNTPFALNENFADDPRVKDSLCAATEIFIEAILDKKAVLVSATDGRIAVKAAREIDRGTE